MEYLLAYCVRYVVFIVGLYVGLSVGDLLGENDRLYDNYIVGFNYAWIY